VRRGHDWRRAPAWGDPGNHTLKIVVGSGNYSSTGTEIDIDSFQVGDG
jgi:hypothetical protein